VILAVSRGFGAPASGLKGGLWDGGAVAMRSFDTLSEREILALAISLEGEDERVYADYAERLRAEFPASAAVLDGMRQEESTHRARLLDPAIPRPVSCSTIWRRQSAATKRARMRWNVST
jgi:erythrin-vacuolar iron transport family protein